MGALLFYHKNTNGHRGWNRWAKHSLPIVDAPGIIAEKENFEALHLVVFLAL